ncbi:conserved hypothetical protein [Parafrankia sp. Ea1.12]|nr:conserved hypothetical protein [Parafrankia sp. Ea1.12]
MSCVQSCSRSPYYLDAADWSGAFPSMPTLAARAEVSVSTARRAVRGARPGGGRRPGHRARWRPPVEPVPPGPPSASAGSGPGGR